ncbi:diffusible signal factor-reguated Ax21 faimly protein [Luteimonas kalidii]|uniref:Diffusible signal factor-reguated Ax21 family protein n=1 Tax=Luteimonas kalidii TaxID=3042025 RepID=A0ABT6JWC6_9GAMM|nr:diffusible signal factor-reguated Ax21 faimly protein [Luteimonas kalidii]MDH5834994.1 diffusible signal factor-reguated Ax21 family protein [Luteimonas kalidii]
MKRVSLLGLAVAAALPFAASAADGVSYNYVEAGYAATNLSDGLPDADGFGARASIAFHPNFHVFGDYANQEFDNTGFDADQWRVGLGYNHEISPRADLLTRVAYEKVDFGNAGDADGWSVEAGARGAFTSNFEGYALAGYQDGDQVDGDFYGRLGATVKFNPNWGLNGDVKVSDGDTAWFVGPRFTW